MAKTSRVTERGMSKGTKVDPRHSYSLVSPQTLFVAPVRTDHGRLGQASHPA